MSFTIRDAARLYGIDGWGNGYFDVDSRGHLVVRPTRGEETVLREGDSAYIRGGTKRSYRNVGKTRASVLGVVAGSRVAPAARDGRALKRAGTQ